MTYGISERRACQATGFGRSSQRYRKRADPQVALRMRLKELAAARVRYGYRRLHILLRREGWEVNHKRTYRIYRDEGLSIRPKLPKRKRAWRYRQGRPAIGGPNEVWAMDFMSDRLFDGRPFPDPDGRRLPYARGALAHTESQFPRLPGDRGPGRTGEAPRSSKEPTG
ncbi:Integrase catalytic region [Methylobacterium oryzae CBMB20]|uniref:Integrase catalytic region n=1 Tax=Methylobacterium oryzae CBMB20 TaxID=693986 RepID=A0A089Q0W3_9HYPH|nr:Integrase catalytic region [Methylobacterium oryzae CBMB20]